MKILILTQTFPLSPTDSTAHFMYDFARGFTELGHNVSVVLPYHPKLQQKSSNHLQFFPFRYVFPNSLHLLGFGNTLKNDQDLQWFVYLLAPFYVLAGLIATYHLVKNEKIDIINAHWILPNGFIAALVSIITGIPLVITLPGSDVYIAKKNIFFAWMAHFALFRAQKVVSNSQQLLDDLGVKGSVISYGVPENKGKRPTHKHVSIATAGRIVEKKGFDLVKKIYPETEIISGLLISEFRKKLLSVDIFIACSIRDSKGNLDDGSLTILEAMSAGCCVIATDLPGNRNIIQDGYNGLLIKPNQANMLKKLVKKLRNSSTLRQQLETHARNIIQEKFTPKHIARMYFSLFSDAL